MWFEIFVIGTATLTVYKVTFGLKAILSLLNIPSDPRYWVTDISKHVKNLSTLFQEVVSYKKF